VSPPASPQSSRTHLVVDLTPRPITGPFRKSTRKFLEVALRDASSRFKREAAPHSSKRDKSLLHGRPPSVSKRVGHSPRTRHRGVIKKRRQTHPPERRYTDGHKVPFKAELMKPRWSWPGYVCDQSCLTKSHIRCRCLIRLFHSARSATDAPHHIPTLRRPSPIHPRHARPHRRPNSYPGPLFNTTPLRHSVIRFVPTLPPGVRDGLGKVSRLLPSYDT
jgi:hypothetical protein